MPLSYDLTTFLDSRAEICPIFWGTFGKSKISKGHSEIIKPLVILYCTSHCCSGIPKLIEDSNKVLLDILGQLAHAV